MNERSDENLVMASRKGDKSAYALLVRRHYKHVLITCVGVGGNIEDAEDITQEALLRGFTQLDKLRNGEQFGPWVAKIARNLCLNLVRRKQRAKQIMADKAVRRSQSQGPNDRLWRAIRNLPVETRVPLVMHYFDGQSVQMVASNLNISQSAVYSRLRTAIRELHELLTARGDTDGQSL